MEKPQYPIRSSPKFVLESREVAYSREPIFALTREQVAFLKSLAADSPRGRARLCAHQAPSDPVHEMLVLVEQRSYLRPHMHLAKSESFHMIEGVMDVVIFSKEGAITDVIPMSADGISGSFYYRLSQPRFHTLLLRSPWVLFHETTSGPFEPSGTVLAEWAPDEADRVENIEAFNAKIRKAVRAHCARMSA